MQRQGAFVCHSFAIIIGGSWRWGVYSGIGFRCYSINPHLAQWGLYHDYAVNYNQTECVTTDSR